VLGAVYSALLSLGGRAGHPAGCRLFERRQRPGCEAAFALAELRSPEALTALVHRLNASADTWFASVLLSAIALTRLPERSTFFSPKSSAMRAKLRWLSRPSAAPLPTRNCAPASSRPSSRLQASGWASLPPAHSTAVNGTLLTANPGYLLKKRGSQEPPDALAGPWAIILLWKKKRK